jgi:hypothetical protein
MGDFERHAVDGLQGAEEAVKVVDGDGGAHITFSMKWYLLIISQK